jgi:hypothetical protein
MHYWLITSGKSATSISTEIDTLPILATGCRVWLAEFSRTQVFVDSALVVQQTSFDE